jgi:hypothetical protein
VAFFLAILFIVLMLAIIGACSWGLYKLVMSTRYPAVRVEDEFLRLRSGEGTTNYKLAAVDHFVAITTSYPGPSWNGLRRDLFAADANGNRNLLYSKDPGNTFSGSYQGFLDSLQIATSKSVKQEDFVEDRDGHIFTRDEFEQKQKNDIVANMMRAGADAWKGEGTVPKL